MKKNYMAEHVMTVLLNMLLEKQKNEGGENCIDKETGYPFINITTTNVDFIGEKFGCYPDTFKRYLNYLDDVKLIKYVKKQGVRNPKILFISKGV